jgi:hypothetical protein
MIPPQLMPYMEKESFGANRPEIQVPEGTTNLARGKPVSSSDNDPVVGELSYVTDGEKTATKALKSNSQPECNGCK